MSVDNSDGVAKESIGDIPTGFPNILGGLEHVVGTRDAGRSLVVDAEATLECVVARRTAGERRGIVVESKLQTWNLDSAGLPRNNRNNQEFRKPRLCFRKST
jgi:hypothetical protein